MIMNASATELVLLLTRTYLRKVKDSGGENISAACPYHKGGRERSPSFSISKDTGLWHCFTCGETGGLHKLLKFFGEDPKKADGIVIEREKPEILDVLPYGILGLLNKCPTDLLSAGFSMEILKDHWIGFDDRYEHMRITFPVISQDGELRGISGRATRDTGRRYKFYSPKDFEGLIQDHDISEYVFHKGHYLWREDKVVADQPIVVVEGFKGALWLAQCKYNVVATMGAGVSDDQIKTLLSWRPPSICFFYDDDTAGRKGTTGAVRKIYKRGVWNTDVRAAIYPASAKQRGANEPDALEPEELAFAINEAVPIHEWARRQLPAYAPDPKINQDHHR